MSQQSVPSIMTAREAAAYLRVSVNWLYLQASRKTIPCAHVGRSVRFRQQDLDKWLASHVTGGSES